MFKYPSIYRVLYIPGGDRQISEPYTMYVPTFGSLGILKDFDNLDIYLANLWDRPLFPERPFKLGVFVFNVTH